MRPARAPQSDLRHDPRAPSARRASLALPAQFKQFDIKGPADRLLVYLTLYCSSLLSKLPADAAAAKRTLPSLAAEGYSVPGDAGFRLGAYFPRPGSDAERDELRAYLKQARDEIATRLVGKCYNADGSRNKWWFAFEKRQFMGLDGV